MAVRKTFRVYSVAAQGQARRGRAAPAVRFALDESEPAANDVVLSVHTVTADERASAGKEFDSKVTRYTGVRSARTDQLAIGMYLGKPAEDLTTRPDGLAEILAVERADRTYTLWAEYDGGR